jgi:hypothetical protein
MTNKGQLLGFVGFENEGEVMKFFVVVNNGRNN